MKKYLLIICLIISAKSSYAQTCIEFIKIESTGISPPHMYNIAISLKKVETYYIPLNPFVEYFVTDKTSYNLIKGYILNYKYSNEGASQRFGAFRISIDTIINQKNVSSKPYYLSSKLSINFFKDFSNYLKLKNCDKSIIQFIDNILLERLGYRNHTTDSTGNNKKKN